MDLTRLTRRRTAALLGAPLFLPLAGRARSRLPPHLTLILMGDLHSGYAWSARLLEAVRREVEEARGSDVRIVVNGDVFERNNAVGRRSEGRLDLALIRGFAGLAPTIVTIGNHDSDLFDPARFAADIRTAGALLLTDITDPRTGALYGDAATTIRAGRLTVRAGALGTPVAALYPKAWRADYQVPDPASYAAERLPALFAGADLSVALVHAGFMADRAVLPALKPPFVLHGAHDHLRFTQRFGPNAMHLQSGAWSSAFQVMTVRDTAQGPVVAARDVVLSEHSPADVTFEAAVEAEKSRLLLSEDRAIVGTSKNSLPLDRAVLFLAEAVRSQTGADMVLLSHTTFGDGLRAGPVSVYDTTSFLRFDGGFSVATIAATTLRTTVLPRCNQFDGVTPYGRRTGDYLYATPLASDRDGACRVVINDYAVSNAGNRSTFLGADLPGFVGLGDLSLSSALARALQS